MVLDLNHILFLIAILTPLAILAKTWRIRGQVRAWRLAAIAVLVVAGGSWFFFRRSAGYIAGGAWFALLFLPGAGLRRVGDLAERGRFRAARHLARAIRFIHPSRDLNHEIELLRIYESRPELSTYKLRRRDPSGLPRAGGITPVVLVLIVLNLLAFLIEMTQRDWQTPWALHRLGALEPYAVIDQHQYWRLGTSIFLHFDVLHIMFNLFALYVLGPALERGVGAFRFIVCYLLSGLGSGLGVIWLSRLNISRADQLVGASGCIMGIVGAWGAFLLVHRHMPLARQRLRNVVMIVVIQVIFDRLTPQISWAAHLCGLATGFVVGFLISPRSLSRNATRERASSL